MHDAMQRLGQAAHVGMPQFKVSAAVACTEGRPGAAPHPETRTP